MWRSASSLVPYLGESANILKVHFNAKITGQLQKPPKWAECVGLVTGTLAHAVGKLYVETHFDEKSRIEAIKMFKDIHSRFDYILEEADWMDPITK
jgi:predicted metalloendopeptidase